jgi:hypothetical protein
MSERKFRAEMEKIKKTLQKMIPGQVENVAEEIEMIIKQAIAIKASGNDTDTPETYTHLCATLIGSLGDKTFWHVLEQTRKVLVIDFLKRDVPPAFRKGWDQQGRVSH